MPSRHSLLHHHLGGTGYPTITVNSHRGTFTSQGDANDTKAHTPALPHPPPTAGTGAEGSLMRFVYLTSQVLVTTSIYEEYLTTKKLHKNILNNIHNIMTYLFGEILIWVLSPLF